VRIPAASCGLVGFKPTRARLPDGPASGEGWAGMAIDGVLTRSLRDTAALIDACAGPDLGAPYWAPPMTQSHLSAMSVDPAPLRVRIGTTDFNGAPVHPDCARAVEHTGQLLADLGHHVDVFTPPADLDVDGMVRAWAEIVACGTALSVRTRLAGAPLDPDLVEPVTRAALRLADRMTGPDYLAAVEEIHDFGRRMARLFVGFDILVTPTLAEPPVPVGRHAPVMDDFLAYRTGPDGVYPYSPFCPAFNASGQPAISLPLAWSADNLPIGVHLAAPFGADEMLMSLSGQIERAAPWHAQQNRLIAAGGLWPRPA
jgi:amidase